MAAAALREGDLLAGKYRIDRVLGQGGMGLVLAAFHLELEQLVAVKVLHPELAERGDAAARFRREARAAAKIKSEHVVRVLDVGKLDGGGAYMVMEYLDGNDLAEEMNRRGQLPVSETLDYLLQACEAISEAHIAGIVHRDLKPANLFLSRRPDGSRVAKVLDFGISKSVVPGSTSDVSLTSTSTLMGSPLYMSPEQMRSARDVDARTDIWSLGVMLFEAITGHPPFTGESVPQICTALLNDPPAPMQTFRPDVPPEIEKIIVRCLAKNPADRWASVGDLANALAPHAPEGSRLHATRANRGKSTLDARSVSGERPVTLPTAETKDPPLDGATSAPTMMSSSPSGPHSATTLQSLVTTGGSDKRLPRRLLWFALGGALLVLAGLGFMLLPKHPQEPEAAPGTLPAPGMPSAAPSPEVTALSRPPPIEAPPATQLTPPMAATSATVTAQASHLPPAKSAATKRDGVGRPPTAKPDSVTDFGGRR